MIVLLAAVMTVSCSMSNSTGQATSAGDKDRKAEIVKLLKSNVGEQVVLEYIKANGKPDEVTSDDLVRFKEAGATEAILLALITGSGKSNSSGDFPFDLDNEHQVGKPVTHGIMAVYPIIRKVPSKIGAYLTLDEATDQKLVVIKEEGSGNVPAVIVSNKGKLPVFISAGEVIIGGKQDRMVAYDVIIEAGKEMTIEVRCVEQGRWHSDNYEFESGKSSGGVKTRVAVQFAQQGDVWNAVAKQNDKLSVRPASGTYNAALSKPSVKKEADEYGKVILPSLNDRNCVGMVVVMNGKIQAIEIFGNPGMFAKLKEKLLKSYVMDTIGEKDEKAALPGKDVILKFYADAMKVPEKNLKKYEMNANQCRETDASYMNESKDSSGYMQHKVLLKK